ncbi:nitroreductase family protein [Paenibacillus chitinolyticus]|uniref:nitroreductase family protein n=1 Tax=Paenibacillus chitinolyticus TaxID=79263 RepID=UPI003866CCFB
MPEHRFDVQNERHAAYDINPIFLNRWSSRAFLEKEISSEILMSLFEAARWAPSASNLQPWRYIVARTEEEKRVFAEFISASNKTWCLKAPVLALILSHTPSPAGGVNGSHAFDAGASWSYLALEAVRQGLISHAMAGFDRESARGLLAVPDDYDIHAVVAIGYHGDAESLSEQHLQREQPSGRRELKETLFAGRFGNSFE